MKQAPTIVLTGGGSGGHITPLLSLARALKKIEPRCRVVYIGQKGEPLKESFGERYRVFDDIYYVSAGKFRRYHGESLLSHLADVRTLALNTRDFFRLLGGIVSADRLLKRLKPDVVFSKGGFVAVPVGVAARRRKVPIVTHDSDAVAGLANRIIGRFAKIHATGMPLAHYAYPTESIHYVGIPIDERIKPVTAALKRDFRKKLGLPANSLVLLIGGAGHGAVDVNNTIVNIVPLLMEQLRNLYIIHITGEKHQPEIAARYKVLGAGISDRVTVLGFTPEFYKYTGAADLIITRAGATTIAELAVQKKAVMLIPASHLAGGHQIKNARELGKRDAAVVIGSDDRPEELLAAILELLGSESKRKVLAENLGSMAKPDAADKLAELLLKTAREAA